MSQRYYVMVPITWGATVNRFRVLVEFNGELNKEAIATLKKTAVDHVIAKGQTLDEHGKIEIYRIPAR